MFGAKKVQDNKGSEIEISRSHLYSSGTKPEHKTIQDPRFCPFFQGQTNEQSLRGKLQLQNHVWMPGKSREKNKRKLRYLKSLGLNEHFHSFRNQTRTA